MERTMDRYPRLNLVGFEMPARVTARGPDYHLERERLLAEEHDFEICRAWLAMQPRRKTVNIRRTTVMLVEMIQRATGLPVAHGAMVVACIHLGIAVQQCSPGSDGAFVAISERAFSWMYKESLTSQEQAFLNTLKA